MDKCPQQGSETVLIYHTLQLAFEEKILEMQDERIISKNLLIS